MRTSKTIFTAIISIMWVQFAFAEAPDWVDNPGGYQFTATLAAAVVLNPQGGVISGDGNDILAAFDAAGNCRGIALNLTAAAGTYDGQMIHEMQIRSNDVGDLITFQFYDASADQILLVDLDYEFVINDVIGSLFDVQEVVASPPLQGCTDSSALNYNPAANVDGCCDFECVDAGRAL